MKTKKKRKRKKTEGETITRQYTEDHGSTMDHGPWTGPIRWPELEPSNLKPSNEPSEAATLYRSQFIFRSTSIQCKVCAFRISHLYMYLYLYLYTDICVSVCRGILSMPSPSLSQSRSLRQSLDSTKWRKKKRNKIKRKSINAKIPKETILMVKVQQSQPHIQHPLPPSQLRSIPRSGGHPETEMCGRAVFNVNN